jgi:hypothetical protein
VPHGLIAAAIINRHQIKDVAVDNRRYILGFITCVGGYGTGGGHLVRGAGSGARAIPVCAVPAALAAAAAINKPPIFPTAKNFYLPSRNIVI